MIRDPSDGSTKSAPSPLGSLPSGESGLPVMATAGGADTRSKHGPNWGLKSLNMEPRKPKPAPTADELRAHYAKHNLGFQPKEQGEQ